MKTSRFAFVRIKTIYQKTFNYEVDQELGGGELSLSACPGVGNRPPRKKKVANSQGKPGGMVAGQIEPCIRCGKPVECQIQLHGKTFILRHFAGSL